MEISSEKDSFITSLLTYFHIILIIMIGAMTVLAQIIPQHIPANIFTQWYQLHPMFSFLLNHAWFYSLLLLDIGIWLAIKLFYSQKNRFAISDMITLISFITIIIIASQELQFDQNRSGYMSVSPNTSAYQTIYAHSPYDVEKYRSPLDLEWKKYESTHFTAFAVASQGNQEHSFLFDTPTKVFDQIFELKQFRESSTPLGVMIDIRKEQSKEHPLVIQAFLNQIIGSQEFFLPFILQRFSLNGNPIFTPLSGTQQNTALSFEVPMNTPYLDSRSGLTLTPYEPIFEQSVYFYTFRAFPNSTLMVLMLMLLIQQFFWWFKKD